jgi:nitroreductase
METATQEKLAVLDAIRKRRAIRHYAPEALSEECIRALLQAAVRAPTAMHLEPWGFVVIQDAALLRRYSDRSKSMMLESRAFEGAPGSSHLDMLRDPAYNIFYDAGTLVVVCRRIDAPFADADCWLAAQNLMLAAVAHGLGTCCIGFAVAVLNAPDVKRELGIPEQGAAVAPIIVGRPLGRTPAVPRKAPEILRWVKPHP